MDRISTADLWRWKGNVIPISQTYTLSSFVDGDGIFDLNNLI